MGRLFNKPLQLPSLYPAPEAMRRPGFGPISYEPEMWEFQYETYDYLHGLSLEALRTRYMDILRNMRALISRDRHAIPISEPTSSWYWFRKEHQTRYEFYRRKEALPTPAPFDTIFDNSPPAPAHPQYPSGGDILFRYDKRCYIEPIANEGRIRLGPASSVIGLENDEARQDEECAKHAFLSGKHTRLTTQDGRVQPVRGDIRRTVSGPDYYMFCAAMHWDPALFEEFSGSDTCLVIKGVEDFSKRIETAAKVPLPNWYFADLPVLYFDPYEMSRNEAFSTQLSKDFRFAYQREYRFVWFPMNGELVKGYRFLDLGNLTDISEIHLKPN